MHSAARQRAALRAFLQGRKGPAGESLAIDAAWVGPPDAAKVLVLLSGTHGVEGFCGSGAQIDWLDNGGAGGLPGGVAVLLVHALNPYGFAWLRRVTHEGIDLNRNWIDFKAPRPDNPGYDELADAFVPRALRGPVFSSAESRIKAFRDREGDAAYQAALTGGQWRHPGGLFYGGKAPAWSRTVLEGIVAEFALPRRAALAVVDFHTGQGPYGYGEPICGHRPDTPGQKRARAWYGDSLTEPLRGTSTAVPMTGLMESGWDRLVGPGRHVFITLEFGTYPQDQGESALRDEQWLHTYGKPAWSEAGTQRIQQALRRFYYPDKDDWREAVLFRARQIIRQALAGLAAA